MTLVPNNIDNELKTLITEIYDNAEKGINPADVYNKYISLYRKYQGILGYTNRSHHLNFMNAYKSGQLNDYSDNHSAMQPQIINNYNYTFNFNNPETHERDFKMVQPRDIQTTGLSFKPYTPPAKNIIHDDKSIIELNGEDGIVFIVNTADSISNLSDDVINSIITSDANKKFLKNMKECIKYTIESGHDNAYYVDKFIDLCKDIKRIQNSKSTPLRPPISAPPVHSRTVLTSMSNNGIKTPILQSRTVLKPSAPPANTTVLKPSAPPANTTVLKPSAQPANTTVLMPSAPPANTTVLMTSAQPANTVTQTVPNISLDVKSHIPNIADRKDDVDSYSPNYEKIILKTKRIDDKKQPVQRLIVDADVEEQIKNLVIDKISGVYDANKALLKKIQREIIDGNINRIGDFLALCRNIQHNQIEYETNNKASTRIKKNITVAINTKNQIANLYNNIVLNYDDAVENRNNIQEMMKGGYEGLLNKYMSISCDAVNMAHNVHSDASKCISPVSDLCELAENSNDIKESENIVQSLNNKLEDIRKLADIAKHQCDITETAVHDAANEINHPTAALYTATSPLITPITDSVSSWGQKDLDVRARHAQDEPTGFTSSLPDFDKLYNQSHEQ